jgi:anti-sigma factor RsiW
MNDDLEILLTQYLDGSLPPDRRAEVESILAADAEARALLDEHRKLDALLRGSLPAPRVDWDRLAGQISHAIDRKQSQPIFSFARNRVRAYIALAASMLIAASITMALLSHGGPAPAPVSTDTVAIVTGPQAEDAAGPAVADIALGPAPGDAPFAQDVVDQPSRVVVSPADAPSPQ